MDQDPDEAQCAIHDPDYNTNEYTSLISNEIVCTVKQVAEPPLFWAAPTPGG